ncbi:UNVERIFIED_CONTAM: hypothetical protein RMT77_004528 [Armadillidium vulgare]
MESNSDTLTKQRSMIKFLHAEGVQNATEIHRCLFEVYGTDIMDVSNVRRWVSRATLSNKGEMSIHNTPRSGRPIIVTTHQHHARVDDMLPISKKCVQAIIADLKYRKLYRWVPRHLTEHKRKQRIDFTNEILNLYR